MPDDTWSLYGPIGIKVTTTSLAVIVWAQYIALLLGVWEMSRIHHLSAIVWMLPLIYPIPWIMGFALRLQLRTRVRQGLMNEQSANFCNGWTTMVLIVAYVAMMGFSQFHAAY